MPVPALQAQFAAIIRPRSTVTPASAQLLVSDDFNRADQVDLGTAPTGQVWSTGNWDIASNQAKPHVASTGFALVQSGVANHRVEAAIFTTTGTTGLAARYASPSQYLYLQVTPGSFLIQQHNPSNTTLASAARTVALGDIVRIDCIGSTVNVYQNGVLFLTATTTALTGTQVGLGGATDATTRIDNFKAYALP